MAKTPTKGGKDGAKAPAKGGGGAKGGGAASGKKASSGGAKGAVSTLPVDAAPTARVGKPRMQLHYEEVVRARLVKQFGLTNPNAVPKLVKIVLNVGLGEGAKTPRLVDVAVEELAMVTGQKAVVTKAKKAIANFGLRAGMPVGCAVTLRGARMYEFLDRLINIAIPRIRDFRGFSGRAFDGQGNYSMGVREQIIFPEIDYDKIDTLRGMDITITTSARNDEEGRALLAAFNFPFRN